MSLNLSDSSQYIKGHFLIYKNIISACITAVYAHVYTLILNNIEKYYNYFLFPFKIAAIINYTFIYSTFEKFLLNLRFRNRKFLLFQKKALFQFCIECI